MILVFRSIASAAIRAFETIICLASVLVLVVLSAGPAYEARLPFHPLGWQWAAAFSLACVSAIVASWFRGMLDGRLPRRLGGEPRHSHISGWTFIWIVIGVVGVVELAQWAATSSANMRAVNRDWGVAVIAGLVVAFVVAAAMPTLDLEQRTAGLVAGIERGVRPFGRILSVIDSILVFAVAGAAGATQTSTTVRYIALFGALSACGTMGYWLQPPWGLVPLAWGVMVAISISRRWAWIEGDRELAMLNRRFVGPHLRIGFTQDLRDEALLSFASLLILAPLMLRQAQIAALGAHIELFNVDLQHAQDLRTWLAFFGTQLAGALPFVQWAGVYDVGGADNAIVSSVASRHVEFAIQCIVNLILLAALLQALAISARNAAQRGLFYEGQLDRLDPFIERREFRKLLRKTETGAWEPDPALVAAFPHYDPIHLSEFAGAERNPMLRRIANAIRVQQGGANVAEFHTELVRRSEASNRDKTALVEVLHAIRAAGPERMLNELNAARKALNNKRSIAGARTLLMQLITEAPVSPARAQALQSALDGDRDNLGPVRIVALRELCDSALRGDSDAVAALREIETSEQLTRAEKRDVRATLKRLALAPLPTPAPSAPASASNPDETPPAAQEVTTQEMPAVAPTLELSTVDAPEQAPRDRGVGVLLGLGAAGLVGVAALAFALRPQAPPRAPGPSAIVKIESAPSSPPLPAPVPSATTEQEAVESIATDQTAAAPSPSPPVPVSDAAPRCPSAAASEATFVTVRSGDTLSQLALQCYGAERYASRIARCNPFLFNRNLAGVSPLTGPDLLYVGDQLTLPTFAHGCPSDTRRSAPLP